jgi:3-hydroxyisobutyrate dehydrogenase
MTQIAFIGTGGMGLGMAATLLRAGYDLVVCNRTPAKAAPLVDAGATLAGTPREAAADADFIISMVGDDEASRAVWLGEEGVLAGRPKTDAVAIECTTLSLAWGRELAEQLAAAGLAYVDCPVTGGRQGAATGALTLLVGAADAVLVRVRPVLESMSKEIVHFGPPGAGTAYKLTVNMMVGVQAVALAEGLLMAERYGLSMDQVIHGLSSGAVASPVVKAYAARMVSGDHDEVVNFSAHWMQKDLAYALQMAAEVDQATPTLRAAEEVLAAAVAKAETEKNITYLIEVLR